MALRSNSKAPQQAPPPAPPTKEPPLRCALSHTGGVEREGLITPLRWDTTSSLYREIWSLHHAQRRRSNQSSDYPP